MSSPSRRTRPVAVKALFKVPVTKARSVDFPTPEGPMIVMTAPGAMVQSATITICRPSVMRTASSFNPSDMQPPPVAPRHSRHKDRQGEGQQGSKGLHQAVDTDCPPVPARGEGHGLCRQGGDTPPAD